MAKDPNKKDRKKEEAVEQNSKRPTPIYSLTADKQETAMMLRNSVDPSVAKGPSITILSTPKPHELGFDLTDDALEFCNHFIVESTTRVNNNGNTELLTLALHPKDMTKEELIEKYPQFMNGDLLYKGKEIGFNPGDISLEDNSGAYIKFVPPSSIFGSTWNHGVFYSTPKRIEKPFPNVIIDATQAYEMTTVNQPLQVKQAFLDGTRFGRTEISRDIATVFLYMDANTGAKYDEAQTVRDSNYKGVSQYLGTVSASEADTIAKTCMLDKMLDDTALYGDNTSQTVAALVDSFSEKCKVYTDIKKAILESGINETPPNYYVLQDVITYAETTRERVLMNGNYQSASREIDEKTSKVYYAERSDELQKEIDRLNSIETVGDSLNSIPQTMRDNYVAVLEKEKKIVDTRLAYLDAIEKFNSLPFVHNKDYPLGPPLNSDEICIEAIRLARDPAQLSRASLKDIVEKRNELLKVITEVSPASSGMGMDEDKKIIARGAIQTVEALNELIKYHPDNITERSADLLPYGVSDKLPVPLDTLNQIEILAKSNMRNNPFTPLKGVTEKTLSSRKECQQILEQIKQNMETAGFVYTDGKLYSDKHTFGDITKGIDISSIKDKIDAGQTSFSGDELKEVINANLVNIPNADKLTIETVVKGMVATEILERHIHSRDYTFDKVEIDKFVLENNKARVLEYMGTHHDEVLGVYRAAAKDNTLTDPIGLAALEKHISIKCNIPTEDLNAMRTDTRDFFVSSKFQEVLSRGQPEGTMYPTMQNICGFTDIRKDLQDPLKCLNARKRLQEEIKAAQATIVDKDKGRTTYSAANANLVVLQGYLDFIDHHMFTNNIKYSQEQEPSLEIDMNRHLKPHYTLRDEKFIEQAQKDPESTLFSAEFLDNPKAASIMYKEYKRLEQSPDYSREFETLDRIVNNPEIRFEMTESQREIMARIEEKDKLFQKLIEDAHADEKFNIKQALDIYREEHPESTLLDDEKFVKQVCEIAWEVSEYHSVSDMYTHAENPLICEAMMQLSAAHNYDIHEMLQDDMNKYIREGTTPEITSEILRRNITDLYVNDPQLDKSTLERHIEIVRSEEISKSLRQVQTVSDEGEISWSKPVMPEYKIPTLEELRAARAVYHDEAKNAILDVVSNPNATSLKDIQHSMQEMSIEIGNRPLDSVLINKNSINATMYDIEREMKKIELGKLKEDPRIAEGLKSDIFTMTILLNSRREMQQTLEELRDTSYENYTLGERTKIFMESEGQKTLKSNQAEIDDIVGKISVIDTQIKTIAEGYGVVEPKTEVLSQSEIDATMELMNDRLLQLTDIKYGLEDKMSHALEIIEAESRYLLESQSELSDAEKLILQIRLGYTDSEVEKSQIRGIIGEDKDAISIEMLSKGQIFQIQEAISDGPEIFTEDGKIILPEKAALEFSQAAQDVQLARKYELYKEYLGKLSEIIDITEDYKLTTQESEAACRFATQETRSFDTENANLRNLYNVAQENAAALMKLEVTIDSLNQTLTSPNPPLNSEALIQATIHIMQTVDNYNQSVRDFNEELAKYKIDEDIKQAIIISDELESQRISVGQVSATSGQQTYTFTQPLEEVEVPPAIAQYARDQEEAINRAKEAVGNIAKEGTAEEMDMDARQPERDSHHTDSEHSAHHEDSAGAEHGAEHSSATHEEEAEAEDEHETHYDSSAAVDPFEMNM